MGGEGASQGESEDGRSVHRYTAGGAIVLGVMTAMGPLGLACLVIGVPWMVLTSTHQPWWPHLSQSWQLLWRVGPALVWLLLVGMAVFHTVVFGRAFRGHLRRLGEVVVLDETGITIQGREGSRHLGWGEIRQYHAGWGADTVYGETATMTLITVAMTNQPAFQQALRKWLPLKAWRTHLGNRRWADGPLVCRYTWGEIVFQGLAAALCAAAPGLVYFATSNPEWAVGGGLTKAAVGAAFTALLVAGPGIGFGGQVVGHLRRLGQVVTVDDQGIAVRSRHGEQRLAWGEVTYVRYGGWQTIVRSEKTTLTVGSTVEDYKLVMRQIRAWLPAGVRTERTWFMAGER